MQISLILIYLIIYAQNRKTPEPLKELDSTKKQIVYTTLIRDQNGLGFSIAGGKGSSHSRENNEVKIIINFKKI